MRLAIPFLSTRALRSLVVWVALVSGAPGHPLASQANAGSSVPCAVPLSWRLDSVDPRFGLAREEVAAALEEATSLWEDAAGSAILPRDPTEGIPVRLRFDERQETLLARLDRERALQDAARSIEETRADLEAWNRALARDHAAHTERVQGLLERIRRHQEEVAQARRAGAVPEEERTVLGERSERLTEEQRALRAAAEELVRREAELAEETRRLNRVIEERNQGRADAQLRLAREQYTVGLIPFVDLVDALLGGERADVSVVLHRIPYFQLRHIVKPGVTGWAQINYPYGNTEEDALHKLQYDLFYIKNYSVLFDLSILVSTIKTVVLRKGT